MSSRLTANDVGIFTYRYLIITLSLYHIEENSQDILVKVNFFKFHDNLI